MLRGLNLKKQNSDGPAQQHNNSSASSSASSSTAGPPTPLQREGWMLRPPPTDGGGSSSASSLLNGNDDVQSGTAGKGKESIRSARELNPYWRHGGNGLPKTLKQSRQTRAPVVGDGGANWRQRALKRAREREHHGGDAAGESQPLVRQKYGQQRGQQQQEDSGKRSAESSGYGRDHYVAFHKGKMRKPVLDAEGRDDDYDSEKWKSGSGSGSNDGRGRKRNRHEKEEHEHAVHRSMTASASAPMVDSSITQSHTAIPPPAAKMDAGDLDEKMNKLAAKAMKAQLLGNDERYRELSYELEELRKQASQPQSQPQTETQEKQKEIVVLPEFDLRGRRIASARDTSSSSTSTTEHVRQMFEDEKLDQSDRLNRQLQQSMTRDKRLGKDQNLDQEYDDIYHSGGIESFDSTERTRRKKSRQLIQQDTEGQGQQRVRQAQIREHRLQSSIFEKCHFCYGASRGSAVFKKHLVIALGEKCLLMLPPFGSLVPQHCIIAPLEHKLSMAHLDEDEQQEVQRFKQSLRKLFSSQNKDVLFMETVTPFNLKRQKHAYLECIPVPMEVGQEAPSFFKKAIMEVDEEWSQNNKLIDTRGRSIQRCVPKDFPYFHVEFGIKCTGYAHVIEDERQFSFSFGKDIAAGMLQLPPNAVKHASKGLHFEKERQQVLSFLDHYKSYDWTVELDGGSY